MQIYEVTDTRFRKYGKVIRNIDFSALTEAMKKTPVPSDVVYEPSIAELEALPVAKEIEKVFTENCRFRSDTVMDTMCF